MEKIKSNIHLEHLLYVPTNTWKYGGSALGTEVARGAQTEIAAMLICGIFPNSSPLEKKSQRPSALICSIENITTLHKCPCRIDISHPRSRNLTRDEACRVPG